MGDELILHNYDFSSYAEKVRLALGYKGLAWRSVKIPPIAPKPDLVALTGGYRRTPVLQIGADVYCDTRLILREIERRKPDPTLFPAEVEGIGNSITFWAENQFFRPLVLLVSGTNHDVMPEGLAADRARMRELPEPSVDAVKRAAVRNAPLVRIQLSLIENLLADGRSWITGSHPSFADFSVYHTLWFITDRTDRLAHLLAPHARISDWMARMKAFGHGRYRTMSAEGALDVARRAEPSRLPSPRRFDEDLPIGSLVSIRPNDYAKDPVVGDLVYLDEAEIAIHINGPKVGDVAVHFPRLGFDLRSHKAGERK